MEVGNIYKVYGRDRKSPSKIYTTTVNASNSDRAFCAALDKFKRLEVSVKIERVEQIGGHW